MDIQCPSAEQLRDIPNHEWTKVMVYAVISNLKNWSATDADSAILAIPERFRTTQFWLKAVIAIPRFAQMVPPHVATSAFFLETVTANCTVLPHVPFHMRTTMLCRAAIRPNIVIPRIRRLMELVPAESQTEDLVCEIIEAMGDGDDTLFNVAVQTERICVLAVTKSPLKIGYVVDQTWPVCEAALNGALRCLAAYTVFTDTLSRIRIHTSQVSLKALMAYGPHVLAHIHEPCEELWSTTIMQTHYAPIEILEHIREPTINICLSAYRSQTNALNYIRSPKMKCAVARLVIADKLMPLQIVGLSALNAVEICERLFVRSSGDPYCLFTRSQLWSLVTFIKHRKW